MRNISGGPTVSRMVTIAIREDAGRPSSLPVETGLPPNSSFDAARSSSPQTRIVGRMTARALRRTRRWPPTVARTAVPSAPRMATKGNQEFNRCHPASRRAGPGPAPNPARRDAARSCVLFLAHQAESDPLVDPPGGREHAVRPQGDLPVPDFPGEPDAFLHETSPQPRPRGLGSTRSSRSFADPPSPFTRKTQPTGSSSISAIQHRSRVASSPSMNSPTMRATSPLWKLAASQRYSSQ